MAKKKTHKNIPLTKKERIVRDAATSIIGDLAEDFADMRKSVEILLLSIHAMASDYMWMGEPIENVDRIADQLRQLASDLDARRLPRLDAGLQAFSGPYEAVEKMRRHVSRHKTMPNCEPRIHDQARIYEALATLGLNMSDDAQRSFIADLRHLAKRLEE